MAQEQNSSGVLVVSTDKAEVLETDQGKPVADEFGLDGVREDLLPEQTVFRPDGSRGVL